MNSQNSKIAGAASSWRRTADVFLVLDFLAEHGEALANGCGLLAGQSAAGRVFRLIGEIAQTPCLTRSIRSELSGIHELLAGAGDVESGEPMDRCGYASADPDCSQLAEIRLLQDGLFGLLQELEGTRSGADDHE